MKQGSNYSSTGFTIIEVMIVMAVSGLILIMAIVLVSGQTNKSEFVSAIQQTQSSIQHTVDNVINGYYPNLPNSISCNLTVQGYPNPYQNSPTNTAMGENYDCVFMGNVLQFYPYSSTYSIYTAVGSRYEAGVTPPQLVDAFLNSNAVVVTNIPGDYTTETLDYGLLVNNVCYNSIGSGSCNNNVGAIVIAGIYPSFGDRLNSGAQHIQLFGLSGTNLGGPYLTSNEALIPPSNGNANLTNNINICFKSATTKQSGLISIDNGSSIGVPIVTLAVKDDTNCT